MAERRFPRPAVPAAPSAAALRRAAENLPAAAAQEAAGLEAKIEALLSLHPKGVDLSLERIARLLKALGEPHSRLPPVIHIAGTNGKGSAAAFARAYLEAAGFSVHAHTSPHLVHWRERYRLGSKQNGKPQSRFVSDAVLAETLAEISAVNGGRPITVFEILTAAAFVLFARFPADAVILETGLGGRFDATNIIPRPACALIMPIGLDHQAFLGDTAAQIAAEKAGIIKPHCPLVLGRQPIAAAKAALVKAAEQKQAASVSLYGRDYRARKTAGGQSWLFCRRAANGAKSALRLPLPHLRGAFQLSNAAAALEAVRQAGFAVSPAQAAEAMGAVYWPGRCEKLPAGALAKAAPENAEIWLDGGHNPAAARALAAALPPFIGQRDFCLIGAMLRAKDAKNYLRALKKLNFTLYAVPMRNTDQGIPPEALRAAAAGLGIEAHTAAGIKQALAAIGARGGAPFILIGGSLYLAGEALAQNGAPQQP